MAEILQIYQIPVEPLAPLPGHQITEQSPFPMLFEVAGVSETLWENSEFHAAKAAAFVAAVLNEPVWSQHISPEMRRLRALVDKQYLGTSFSLRGNDLSILMDHIPGMRTYMDAFWPNRAHPRLQKRQYLSDGQILSKPPEPFLSYHARAMKEFTTYPASLDTVLQSKEEQVAALKKVARMPRTSTPTVLFRFVEK